MTDEEIVEDLTRRFHDDFEFYAPRCLKIQTKRSTLEPFALNTVQRKLHAIAEKQRAETGKVRILVLKARRLGISTYIQARGFHKASLNFQVRVFIITHHATATLNLFTMTRRFYDYCPEEMCERAKRNAMFGLEFAEIGSSYAVATAGSQEIGRSDTAHFFHGSEVAFWENADSHVRGALQIVGDVDNTEVWLESTANGIGDAFHKQWKAAVKGETDFIPVFLAWHEHEEYQRAQPPGWKCPQGWKEYRDAYELTPAQLYWAFRKNAEIATPLGLPLDEPCWGFRQEYPANPEEAFQTAGGATFVNGELVAHARTRKIEGVGPLIIGVDPAGGGRDTTGVIDRQGRAAGRLICDQWRESNTMTLVSRIADMIVNWSPALVNIDVTGGLGQGIYDRLRELHYTNVRAVGFGERAVGSGPQPANKYANRRVEMWDAMRAWFEDPAGVCIPDSDELAMHILAPRWEDPDNPQGTRFTSERVLQLEQKKSIIKRAGFSPDLGDALALTFAEKAPPEVVVEKFHNRGHSLQPEAYDPLEW